MQTIAGILKIENGRATWCSANGTGAPTPVITIGVLASLQIDLRAPMPDDSLDGILPAYDYEELDGLSWILALDVDYDQATIPPMVKSSGITVTQTETGSVIASIPLPDTNTEAFRDALAKLERLTFNAELIGRNAQSQDVFCADFTLHIRNRVYIGDAIEAPNTSDPDWLPTVNAMLQSIVANAADELKGDPGAPGAAPAFEMGSVTTLPAGTPADAQLIAGENNSYTLNLALPAGNNGIAGADGADGITPILNIGNIATVSETASAAAALVDNGDGSYTLNLSLPKGERGAAGPGILIAYNPTKDATANTWHNSYSPADSYWRFSYDHGITWSSPIALSQPAVAPLARFAQELTMADEPEWADVVPEGEFAAVPAGKAYFRVKLTTNPWSEPKVINNLAPASAAEKAQNENLLKSQTIRVQYTSIEAYAGNLDEWHAVPQPGDMVARFFSTDGVTRTVWTFTSQTEGASIDKIEVAAAAASDWHDIPESADRYMKISIDGGANWYSYFTIGGTNTGTGDGGGSSVSLSNTAPGADSTNGSAGVSGLAARADHTHPVSTLYATSGALSSMASTLNAAIAAKLDAALKGVPNGLATLGADGKIPAAQLPENIGTGTGGSGEGGSAGIPEGTYVLNGSSESATITPTGDYRRTYFYNYLSPGSNGEETTTYVAMPPEYVLAGFGNSAYLYQRRARSSDLGDAGKDVNYYYQTLSEYNPGYLYFKDGNLCQGNTLDGALSTCTHQPHDVTWDASELVSVYDPAVSGSYNFTWIPLPTSFTLSDYPTTIPGYTNSPVYDFNGEYTRAIENSQPVYWKGEGPYRCKCTIYCNSVYTSPQRVNVELGFSMPDLPQTTSADLDYYYALMSFSERTSVQTVVNSSPFLNDIAVIDRMGAMGPESRGTAHIDIPAGEPDVDDEDGPDGKVCGQQRVPTHTCTREVTASAFRLYDNANIETVTNPVQTQLDVYPGKFYRIKNGQNVSISSGYTAGADYAVQIAYMEVGTSEAGCACQASQVTFAPDVAYIGPRGFTATTNYFRLTWINGELTAQWLGGTGEEKPRHRLFTEEEAALLVSTVDGKIPANLLPETAPSAPSTPANTCEILFNAPAEWTAADVDRVFVFVGRTASGGYQPGHLYRVDEVTTTTGGGASTPGIQVTVSEYPAYNGTYTQTGITHNGCPVYSDNNGHYLFKGGSNWSFNTSYENPGYNGFFGGDYASSAATDVNADALNSFYWMDSGSDDVHLSATEVPGGGSGTPAETVTTYEAVDITPVII